MFDAEQRVVIVCNERYAEMYGLTPEQVKPGTTLRQIFEYRLANGYYARPGHRRLRRAAGANDFGEVSSRDPGAGRRAHHQRHAPADAPTAAGVITHEDITERERLNARLEQQNMLLKAQEEKLRAQNVQLDAALNNMAQGLAMFDAEQRLVICNKRYAEMYGLSPEQVKPGTPLREILEHRIANGEFQRQDRRRAAARSMRARRRASSRPQYTQRAERRPPHRRVRAADGRRRHGHHASGHHRAAPLRGQDRAHGAARRADRTCPTACCSTSGSSMRWPASSAARSVAVPPARSRPLQERERHARPSRRRQAAEDGGRAPARPGAGDRHDRAHGRRRVRHRAGRASRSRPTPPRWRSASSRRVERSPTTSTATRS